MVSNISYITRSLAPGAGGVGGIAGLAPAATRLRGVGKQLGGEAEPKTGR